MSYLNQHYWASNNAIQGYEKQSTCCIILFVDELTWEEHLVLNLFPQLADVASGTFVFDEQQKPSNTVPSRPRGSSY